MATSVIEKTTVTHEFAHTTASLSHAIARNNSATITENVTKSGWYPVGIVGWQINGTQSSTLRMLEYKITSYEVGSGTVSVTMYNFGSNASSGTVEVLILWQR